jgi:plasmid stabilization system protein ParE
MVEINWTKEAELWLKDIHDYIAKDSPKIAKKVINDIYNKVQILKSFSQIGYIYNNVFN